MRRPVHAGPISRRARQTRAMPRAGAYTLANGTEPMLELVCRKCDRFGRDRADFSNVSGGC
jgi:hypothetical protein